jgi:hypothetical protein
MPTQKPINIAGVNGKTTAHAQAAEFAVLAGASKLQAAALTEGNSIQVQELTAQVEALTTENEALTNNQQELSQLLTAEKEAHEKTQAALTAATAA